MKVQAASPVRVVVLGDIMLDVVTVLSAELAHGSDTASQVSLRPGGSAANLAAWSAAGGTATTCIGRVGDDDAGRQVLTALRTLGVDTRISVDAASPTGICVVLVAPDGERTMLPAAGANARLSPADVEMALLDADDGPWHLHVSGYALLGGAQDAALHALARARARGAPTSVTCASAAPLRRIGPASFLGMTRGVRLLFANADEAAVLSGRQDPADAAAQLTRTYSAVVVTCGPAGATYAEAGQQPIHSAALPVAVLDSTGAGDAFAAGFLPAWSSGVGAADALAAGHRCAALAVSRLGGLPTATAGEPPA